MKKQVIIYLLFLSILACKPAKADLVFNASYSNIEKETRDAKINAIVAPYKSILDSVMDQAIGYSEVEMPKVKDQPETVLGNFVADLVYEFSTGISGETDFAVLNNGGLRSSLPQGVITVRNIFELMPFDNEIVIVTLEGASVSKLFAYIAERGGVPVSGVTMKLEKTDGIVIPQDIKIKGQPFSMDRSYKIATSDYLSGGGDNMNFWGTGSVKVTGKKIRDAIIDFIRLKTAENKKLSPVLDQRITWINK